MVPLYAYVCIFTWTSENITITNNNIIIYSQFSVFDIVDIELHLWNQPIWRAIIFVW